MRDEQQRLTLRLEPPDPLPAFFLKCLVADGQHLIHNQNVRIDINGDGKRQPHGHSHGVGPNRFVYEISYVGKRENPFKNIRRAFSAHAQ